MKKSLLILLSIVLYVSGVLSQFNTGSLFISGTTNFKLDLSTAKNKSGDGNDEKCTCFSFTPKAGYFIKNRIAAGVLYQYDYEGTKLVSPNGESKEGISEWCFGPLGRYYLEYGKIIPFAELSAAMGGQKKTHTIADAVSETHSLFRAAVGAGANYLLNDHVGLESIIEYVYSKYKPTTEGATGDGYHESGISFRIGVVVYFGKI